MQLLKYNPAKETTLSNRQKRQFLSLFEEEKINSKGKMKNVEVFRFCRTHIVHAALLLHLLFCGFTFYIKKYHYLSRRSFCLFFLFTALTFNAIAQGPLERSVQVSSTVQNDPPQINFSWVWDWSGPDYTIYRKTPGAADWGTPRAVLPWQATEWIDTEVEVGVAYEYAFFKRRWQDILDTVCVVGGTELTFTVNNVFGDGLCCNFGFGNYEVRGCDEIYAAGADFGFIKDHNFTVCGNANNCEEIMIKITPDMLPNNTWWSLKNTQTGEVIIDSGEPRTNLAERAKYGFIQTGIDVAPIEYRGTILLLIDDLFMDSLNTEITQLQNDFRADGWRVKEAKVNRNASVPNVKNLIRTINSQTDDLTAVMLLGHIPVPYSGNFYADGHSENHW
ncbi:MAG: hypothetical protein AB8G22_20380, partial [Saprospiraceae bacterium]